MKLGTGEKVALTVGAALAGALGIFALLAPKPTEAPSPPPPPLPEFGAQRPEVLQVIGPYGVQTTGMQA